ncbi:MAG: hypothetical protein C0503_08265 [Gemmatimonas sp.]|nr:hypothetical protein [Gemmatimonas sp.]
MRQTHSLVIAVLASLLAAPAAAQATAGTSGGGAAASATAPAANPRDVESIDAIMAAIYDVISGPAGQPRDWNRFRSLMSPHARLIPTGISRATGQRVHRALTADEYVAQVGPQLERDGFFERELGRKVERYGNIVHLMSAYDSKRRPQDAEPFTRGVNSVQLWFDGTRWWVVTIFWEAETPATPIPAELLRGRP